MISISRYSKTMYVVRGRTGAFKNKLKSYGMKWTRKLKGGPGYILRVNSKSDVYALNEIKKIVFESNQNYTKEHEYELSAMPFQNKKRKYTQYGSFPAEKRIKSVHMSSEPEYTVVYESNWYKMINIMSGFILTFIYLFVAYFILKQGTDISYDILNMIYNYISTIEYSRYTDIIYDYISKIEYDEFNFTIIYPIVNIPAKYYLAIDY